MSKDTQKKGAKKVRVPTAKKRDIQNIKKQETNQTYKSRAKTAIQAFKDALKTKDEAVIKEKGSIVQSILDKCVKVGVFKINKASRMKSRTIIKASK